MTKGIQVTVEYGGDNGPYFVLNLNGKQHYLTLDEVDVLSDLLRLKVEEAIRRYEGLLNKAR